MKNILFIGFSVTVQKNGYIDYLKKDLSDYEISTFAIGGENMHTILYLLNKISFDAYDICILEMSTSRRWLKNDYNRYYGIINFIINYISCNNTKLGILDFSRADINEKQDVLHTAIYHASIYNNIPIVRYLYEDSDNFFTDGIHTKSYGSKVYAKKSIELLNEINTHNFNTYSSNFYKIYNEYSPMILEIDSVDISQEISNDFFEKKGVRFNLFNIKESSSIDVEFKNNLCINGLLLKIGPKTSRLHILKDDQILYDFLPYDERNYYERYYSVFFRIENTKTLTIASIREENRPKLLKGEEDNSIQSISILGFYVSKIRLPF